MMLKSALYLALLSMAYCTNFSPCKTGNVPINVQINDCIKEPCIFHAGSHLDSNITFDAPYDIENMESSIKVHMGIISIPYPIASETCKNLVRGWCPLEEGERAIYNFQMTLPSVLPPISLTLEIMINVIGEDGTKDQIVCLKVKGKSQPT